MKKTHIIAIVLIAISLGAIVTTINDSSTYADFSEAFENAGEEFHVVGVHSNKSKTHYNPQEDANKFIFYMTDNNGIERKVILYKSKPQDFERSEQIVIIGKAVGEEFHANDILMKCPSKYDDGTPQLNTADRS